MAQDPDRRCDIRKHWAIVDFTRPFGKKRSRQYRQSAVLRAVYVYSAAKLVFSLNNKFRHITHPFTFGEGVTVPLQIKSGAPNKFAIAHNPPQAKSQPAA